MKAARLLRGAKLPEHKVALVRMAGKLITHFDNLSASLFFTTELREDEEPRVALDIIRGDNCQLVAQGISGNLSSIRSWRRQLFAGTEHRQEHGGGRS